MWVPELVRGSKTDQLQEKHTLQWGGGGAPSSVTYIFIILKIAIVSNIQSITYKEEVPISSSKANIPI